MFSYNFGDIRISFKTISIKLKHFYKLTYLGGEESFGTVWTVPSPIAVTFEVMLLILLKDTEGW